MTAARAGAPQERGVTARPAPHFEALSFAEARRRMEAILNGTERRKARKII